MHQVSDGAPSLSGMSRTEPAPRLESNRVPAVPERTLSRIYIRAFRTTIVSAAAAVMLAAAASILRSRSLASDPVLMWSSWWEPRTASDGWSALGWSLAPPGLALTVLLGMAFATGQKGQTAFQQRLHDAGRDGVALLSVIGAVAAWLLLPTLLAVAPSVIGFLYVLLVSFFCSCLVEFSSSERRLASVEAGLVEDLGRLRAVLPGPTSPADRWMMVGALAGTLIALVGTAGTAFIGGAAGLGVGGATVLGGVALLSERRFRRAWPIWPAKRRRSGWAGRLVVVAAAAALGYLLGVSGLEAQSRALTIWVVVALAAVAIVGLGVLLLTSWWTARNMVTIRLVWGAGMLVAAVLWFQIELQLVRQGAVRLAIEDDLTSVVVALLAPPLALGALSMMLIVTASSWLKPLGRWAIWTEIRGMERSLRQVKEERLLHRAADLPAQNRLPDVPEAQPAGPAPTATAAAPWLGIGAWCAAVVGTVYLLRRGDRSSEL